MRSTPTGVIAAVRWPTTGLADNAMEILLGWVCFQSPLDAHHLLQRVHHFDEILLRRHHGLDVLVGRGRLVDHVLVLAALDAFGGRSVIGQREAALGLAAAHRTAGAVRAALEALCIALAAHDVAARAHAAGDDAQLPGLRAHRALA